MIASDVRVIKSTLMDLEAAKTEALARVGGGEWLFVRADPSSAWIDGQWTSCWEILLSTSYDQVNRYDP